MFKATLVLVAVLIGLVPTLAALEWWTLAGITAFFLILAIGELASGVAAQRKRRSAVLRSK
jgi:hypothetical protein